MIDFIGKEQLKGGKELELVNWVILAGSFLAAIGIICAFVKKVINKAFEPVNKKLDKVDLNRCKDFLVDFLADVENGIEKDEIQIQRAYEVYDHYVKDLDGNSYIHDKWVKLMK